jgi:hypothetical protein
LRLSAPILLKLLAEISSDHSIHPRTDFFQKVSKQKRPLKEALSTHGQFDLELVQTFV